jgi:hypothetical protein
MGELYAFDASDLTRNSGNGLWSSNLNDAFDGIGILAKYNPPTIANGRVYVASASGQLHVFGLLPDSPPPLVRITAPTTRATIVGPAHIALMATALSRDGKPGTVVELYDGDALIGGSSSEPYRIVWQNAPLGHHTLVALATGQNGASARSSPVEIDVVSHPPPVGSIISIQLAGNTLMEPEEVAGALAQPNWNNAVSEDPEQRRKEGWLNTLVDGTGAVTGARLSWTSSNAFVLPIYDIPGDFRMMRGHLDTTHSTSTHVTVYDLPTSFTANGYDVYVYFDGSNEDEARKSNYRVGSTVVSGTDAPGVNFSGDFTEAIADSKGNYVVIPGLAGDRFTLEAIPPTSGNGTRRAPVNGLQIVAHGQDISK